MCNIIMGAVCCNQPEPAGPNGTYNLENAVDNSQRKQYVESDMLNENVTAQQVLPTTTRSASVNWAKPAANSPRFSSSKILRVDIDPPMRAEAVVPRRRLTAIGKSLFFRQQLSTQTAGNAERDISPGNRQEAAEERKVKRDTAGFLRGIMKNLKIEKMGSMDLSPRANSIAVDPSGFVLEKKGGLEDKYEILYTLGRGAFGEVKRVRDRSTGVQRAVKVVFKDRCVMTDKFTEEIEVLKKLDHPNVLRLLEFFQDEQCFYLVTELCEGGDLLSLLSTLRHIEESEVISIMRQALAAVRYCHRLRIVHRDIKLENVLFLESSVKSTIKVIDFGRSKILRPNKKMKELAGSLYYVAPEVLSGTEYNELCDVWSCGVILYMLLSGKPPFLAKSRDSTVGAILTQDTSFAGEVWDSVSFQAKDLVLQMLNKDPKQRITAEAALNHPWIAGGGPSAYMVGERRNVGKAREKTKENSGGVVESLRNLRNFKAQNTLQKAVMSYIASQERDTKTEHEMRSAFLALDEDHNGQITEKELVECYQKLNKSKSLAKKEALAVIRRADVNKNGAIDYNEFIMAHLASKKSVDADMLKQAFDFYDENKDGEISVKELGTVFGTLCTEAELGRIMAEVDTNGDNKLSFAEFETMMDRFVATNKNLRAQWSMA